MSLPYKAPLFTRDGGLQQIYPHTRVDLVDQLQANYTVSVVCL